MSVNEIIDRGNAAIREALKALDFLVLDKRLAKIKDMDPYGSGGLGGSTGVVTAVHVNDAGILFTVTVTSGCRERLGTYMANQLEFVE